MNDLYLGIDTSNYRTSLALVDADGEILYNFRKLLPVPLGKRGLRQSEAFFRHVQVLPEAVKDAMEYSPYIKGISISSRPRPREGSYMPCFTAGTACASELAAALHVPLIETSHQEGHIEAIRFYSSLKDEEDMLFFHFSGGTTEALYRDEIVGGTLDISYGQVLDRLGVSLGMSFPSGEELDGIALEEKDMTSMLKPIKVKDGRMNLSGIETQSLRGAESLTSSGNRTEPLVKEVFTRLSDSVLGMMKQLSETCGTKNYIFAGGFSSSEFLRAYIMKNMTEDMNIVFGDPELSGDNAVGTALIGMKKITTR